MGKERLQFLEACARSVAIEDHGCWQYSLFLSIIVLGIIFRTLNGPHSDQCCHYWH